MSDEVWKGRACSGIPKNVGGSIKREHVAAFDVCQGSPCQSHNPGIGTIAGGSAQYARLRPIAPEPTITPSNDSSNCISGFTPLRKVSAFWDARFLITISFIIDYLLGWQVRTRLRVICEV